MMRGITILWVLLAMAAGVGLYLLKHDVQTMEERLARLNRQITKDRTEIHVLQAEWTYLNDPERLSALVAKHLPGLQPVQAGQVNTLASLPTRQVPQSGQNPNGQATPPARSARPRGRRSLSERTGRRGARGRTDHGTGGLTHVLL
jgi:cell division protein FtsL